MTAVASDTRPATRRAGPRWMGRYFSDRGSKAGAAGTALIILVGVCGPWLAPHPPSAIVGVPFQAPGPDMLLGGDFLGEDVLSRILCGGRSVIWMSFAATAITLVVGVTIGMIAGYSGRRTDAATVWSMDVLLALPDIVMVLMFIVLLGRDPWIIVMITALSFLPVVVRLVRGLTLEVVGREHVESARAMGFSRRDIVLQEVLPNVLTPVLVQAGALLTWSIGLVAGISFLGFGVQPPAADWGLMISENFSGVTVQPLAVVAPIVMITLFTIATNALAEGVGRSFTGVERSTAS
ncbi:ABC transporter permease [Streptomyces sp. NPDC058457]|uniref:ABC transporter permease n=1 Tax=Streptomyces sp. NPDC058457 TaxID=3346507 RepID=UPI0036491A9E